MELSLEEKKEKGIFYTPPFLADYVARKALQYAICNNTILDPACGDGALLLSLSKLHKEGHYYGIDCERNAINDAITRLSNISFLGIKADSILPYKAQTREAGWKRLRKTCKTSNGFDIIISNPPWGSDLSAYDKRILKEQFFCGAKQFDSYDLFVEIILDQLSNNGTYALIVPDTIFSQEHANTRQLLVENTSIKLICRLGEGIFPNINIATAIIVGVKNKDNVGNVVKSFKITKSQKHSFLNDIISLDEIEESNYTLTPQHRFLTNPEFRFDIDITDNDISLMERLSSFEKLERWVNIYRGAEISKKGSINQCPVCNKWFAVPRVNSYKCPHCGAKGYKADLKSKTTVNINRNDQTRPLITGEDMFRFTAVSRRNIEIGYDGIKYKSPSLYKGAKILVRKTGLGITSCLDYSGAYTVQCIYIIKRKNSIINNIPLELISIILCSRLATYFLLKSHGDTEWKSHPYLTQSMIKEIPIPCLISQNEDILERIKKYSKIIKENVCNSKSANIDKKLDLELERLVADLYGLSESDYAVILSTIAKADQLIPIQRLGGCKIEELFKNGI